MINEKSTGMRPLVARNDVSRFCMFVLLGMLLQPVWAEIRVVDDAGVPVVLEKSAQRIVSLAPYLTELLFAAGAGESAGGCYRIQ